MKGGTTRTRSRKSTLNVFKQILIDSDGPYNSLSDDEAVENEVPL